MDDGFREQLEAAVSLNSPLGSAAIVAAILHLLETRRDPELDGLYARLRDAEDARKAAVGIIEKQNAELADVRHERRSMAERAGKAQATLARVRALGEQWKYTGDRKGGPLKELLQALDA